MKKTKMQTTLGALLLFSSLALAGCGSGESVKIGILQFGTFDALTKAKEGFVTGLQEEGYTDGGNIQIQVLNPEADSANNTQMAATLAASSDLAYGIATPSATALKNAIDATGRNIPLIFSAVTDPVGAKLVDSLAAPGHNVTGLSDLGPIKEELTLLEEFEDIDKVATLITSGEANSVYQVEIAKNVIAELNTGWAVSEFNVSASDTTEIKSTVAAIPTDVDALFIPTDDNIANHITLVKEGNEAREGHPLIVLCCDVGMIEGAVIGMGVDYNRLGVQAGKKAAAILKGADPASLPVETCDGNLLYVNKTEAKKLGLTIPDTITASADTVL